MVSCWALGVTGASAILLVSGANSGPFGVWDCVQRGQKGSGGPQLLQPVARRGCIFAWLAAWPGGSQDWFWQIGVWGLVLVLRSSRDISVIAPASACVLRVEWAPPNCCHLCLCFHGETQLLPASPGVLLISLSGPDTEAFEITASSLKKKKKKLRSCVCLLRVIFVSYSHLDFPNASPDGLHNQIFWGLIYPMQDTQAGEPWWQTLQMWLFFLWVTYLGMWVLSIPCLHISYSSHCISFFIFLVEELHCWLSGCSHW